MEEETKKTTIEKQFDMTTIKIEQEYLVRFIEKVFREELAILEKVIASHVNLVGYFVKQSELKKFQGLVYDENIVLNNAVIEHIYLSLSILELLRKGYYGSARMLLRRSFEMLIVAKYCEYNPDARDIWNNYDKKDSKSKTRISMGAIFSDQGDKRKELNTLRDAWKELNVYTHATPFAGQHIRLPIITDEKTIQDEFIKWIESANLITDMYYTLDLFFTLLSMLFHLNNLFHRKVRRFYMGYYEDPLGYNEKIQGIKSDFNRYKTEYFGLMESRGVLKKHIRRWKRIIHEYKSNWS